MNVIDPLRRCRKVVGLAPLPWESNTHYFRSLRFIMLYRVVLTFEGPFKWKQLNSSFPWYYLLYCTRWFLHLSLWISEILWCDYSNQSNWKFFPVVLFIILYKVVLTVESEDEILYGVTIQVKATEQFFPVVLFIMLYKVVLTVKSVDEILWCDHLNESNWAVLSRVNFWVW